jgi:hypothetical protein
MHAHREHERTAYPPGVYDGLDRQLETLSYAQRPIGEPVRALVQHTLFDGSGRGLYGPDTPTRPGPGAVRRASRETPAARSRAEPPAARTPIAAELADRRPPRARAQGPSRFVQVDQPLPDALTRTVVVRGASHGYWLGIGGAIGVAGALALLTLALRTRPPERPTLPVLPTILAPADRAEARGDAGMPHASEH